MVALDPFDLASESRFEAAARIVRHALGLIDADPAVLELAVGRRDPAAATRALDSAAMASYLTTELSSTLASQLRTAGREEARGTAVVVRKAIGASIAWRFDLNVPQAIRWAEAKAANLVVEIDASTRDAIRALVVRAVSQGGHPYAVARDVRGLIGLHSSWALAVYNRQLALQAAGISPERVAALTKTYYDSLLKTRSETIARTEILDASNMGRQASWLDAINQGYLPATATKTWMIAEGAEENCVSVDGQEVGVADDFDTPFGPMQMPPMHPNAVLAGSTFAPYGRLEEMAKAWYRGPARSVRVGDDRTTIIGPNHPMLTGRGMIPARDLREGDYLVCDMRVQGRVSRSVVPPDLQEVPLVEDSFESASAGVPHACVPASRDDLHGDGEFVESEVEVVWPEGYLLPVLDPCGVERLREDPLARADAELALVSGAGSLGLPLRRVDLSASRGMGGGRSWGAHFAILPITDLGWLMFDGWAFDATTASSLYCSDGFVVSNCRCTAVVSVGSDEIDLTPPEGADVGELTVEDLLAEDASTGALSDEFGDLTGAAGASTQAELDAASEAQAAEVAARAQAEREALAQPVAAPVGEETTTAPQLPEGRAIGDTRLRDSGGKEGVNQSWLGHIEGDGKVIVKPESGFYRDGLRAGIEPGSDIANEVGAYRVNEQLGELVRMGKTEARDAWFPGGTVSDRSVVQEFLDNVGNYGDRVAHRITLARREVWQYQAGDGGAFIPFDPATFEAEQRATGIFDAIIGNLDRHSGNMLISPDGHLLAIDHGLAFVDGDARVASSETEMFNAMFMQREIELTDNEVGMLETFLSRREAVDAELRSVGLKQGQLDSMWARVQYMVDGRQVPAMDGKFDPAEFWNLGASETALAEDWNATYDRAVQYWEVAVKHGGDPEAQGWFQALPQDIRQAVVEFMAPKG